MVSFYSCIDCMNMSIYIYFDFMKFLSLVYWLLIIGILFCFRYTDRGKSAVHHFKQALSIDPLMWAAYEELCVLGLYKKYLHGFKFFNCCATGIIYNFVQKPIG